jgi:2-amino-4-hydroxy-6-hydroxymethyldihydropteridine diphosphokinase
MARAFVALGSNIDPATNVREAIRYLSAREKVIAMSTVYLSEPEGRSDQARFYNCVVSLETQTPPQLLKETLRAIEDRLGRIRTSDKFAPRTADLDLILYDDLVMRTPEMVVPDPEIAVRPFLAVPLHELAPDLILPETKEPISTIAARLPRNTIQPLEEYTANLRDSLASQAYVTREAGMP